MSSPYPSAPRPEVITVGELNRAAKKVLEQAFPLIWVAGEISNLTRAPSGHWYFSLKDDRAQVRCVMFRHRNQYLDFAPEGGMQVEVRALVTLYEPRGEFQVYVEEMRRAGLGALFEAFEKLKAQLEREGLFDPARKKPLPAFPRRVGVITSPAAAALRDVLTTLRRRMPGLPVIVYPTPVQGEGAAQKIAGAIRGAVRRAECDVLILCRGGGSIEDLWPFNQEIVARAVFECPIPIVCGVGHETDFTIADFVADRRAPTPTAAAEMVSPNRVELAQRLASIDARMSRLIARGLEARMQHLDHVSRRLVHPGSRLASQSAQLLHLRQRLESAYHRRLDNERWRLQQAAHRLQAVRPDLDGLLAHQRQLAQRLGQAAAHRLESTAATLGRLQGNLQHLNPASVLERGYSLAQTRAGRIVRDSAEVAVGDELKVVFARGWAKTLVTGKDAES